MGELHQGLGVLKHPKIFKTGWLGAWVAPPKCIIYYSTKHQGRNQKGAKGGALQ